MNIEMVIAAIAWGALAGYLILRCLDSFVAIGFALHGLLTSRWKRLANRAAPGQVKYAIILRLLLQVSLYLCLFGFLLEVGDSLIRKAYRDIYHGTGGLILGGAAAVVVGWFLRISKRRLVLIWRITHEVGFAEKRQRTFLLRG